MKKFQSGFTLIELIVTLGIFIVLSGIVFFNLAGRRTNTDLTDTTEQITATLREAQSDATAQKNNVAWGVHFSNLTATTGFYELFSGNSYVSGTVVGHYTLPPDIQYSPSSIAVGTSTDIIFAQVTGIPNVSTSITLYQVASESAVVSSSTSSSPVLSRQSSGKVFFDNFSRSSL